MNDLSVAEARQIPPMPATRRYSQEVRTPDGRVCAVTVDCVDLTQAKCLITQTACETWPGSVLLGKPEEIEREFKITHT